MGSSCVRENSICLDADEDRQVQSLEILLGKIQSELPAALKNRFAYNQLLDSINWVLGKNKYIHTAEVIFKQVVDLIGAKTGYLAIYNESQDELEVLASCGTGAACPVTRGGAGSVPMRGLRRQVLQNLETVHIPDFKTSEHAGALPPGHVVLDSILLSPMVIEGKGRGIIGLANKPAGFTPSDTRLTGLFAEFAARTLVNSRAWRRLNTSGSGRSVPPEISGKSRGQVATP